MIGKEKVINTTKWSLIAQVGTYTLNFILSIFLARLLTPLDFGLTGLLTVFISVSIILVNSGFLAALVRLSDVDEADFSTVFFFNLIVSVFLYLILFFASPLIASFFNEPKLILLTRLIALVVILNSFGIVQNAVLLRSLDIRLQTISNLIGMLFSAIVSIVMALNGYGVYSLVGQILVQAFVTNTLLWILIKWRPSFVFSIYSLKKLWSYGSKILTTNLFNVVVDNIDNVVIGKLFSTESLGFFVRAKNSKSILESIFGGTVNTSSFAVLSKVNVDKKIFNKLHFNYYEFVMFLYLPAILGFMVVSDLFVEIVYSEKWLPAVPFIRILCISSVTVVLDGLFNQTLLALGEAKMFMKVSILKKIILLFSIPFGVFYGMDVYVWAIVSLQIIGFAINIYITSTLLNISMATYIKSSLFPLLNSIIMIVVLFFFRGLIVSESLIIQSTILVVLGTVIYILLSAVFSVNQFKDTLVFLQSKALSKHK